MRNEYLISRYLWSSICLLAILSCNKKEFLDEPPSSDLIIPRTLAEFRALLEHEDVMSETPMMGEVSADNYYISNQFYTFLKTREHYCYTWEDSVYGINESSVGDWDKPYQQVFYANVVLDGLEKIKSNKGGDPTLYDELKGSAYFIRAYAFHNVAQLFSPPYDQQDDEFGIPLRTNPEVIQWPRSSVHETYWQIKADLDSAVNLLQPIVDSNHLNRPTKPTVYALLARVYLGMRKYDSALLFANRSLAIYDTLLDYNGLNPLAGAPFSKKNVEILYQSRILSTTNVLKAVVVSGCYVDSNLYKSYSTDDWRRSLYYTTGSPLQNLRRSYVGAPIFLFSGLANDEVYLIKAESLARTGNFIQGMNVLNQLMVKRYKTGYFAPLVASNEQEALDTILNERRKELSFRGVRWSDLRRLNKEGRNIKIRRTVNGQDFELLPNSKKYVFLLPDDVVHLGKVKQYRRN